MKLTELIHYQVKSFLQAGKAFQEPKDEKEKRLSRIIGMLLIVTGIGIYVLIFNLDFLPARIHIRAILIIGPLIALAIRFYKGISISWIINGIRNYWLIPSLILYMYIVVALMFYGIFVPDSFFIFSYAGGLMLLAMGFLIPIYCRVEACSLLEKDNSQKITFHQLGAEDKTKFLVYHFYGLIFVAFFIGGLFMLTWVTGLADWFFQDFLGW